MQGLMPAKSPPSWLIGGNSIIKDLSAAFYNTTDPSNDRVRR